MIAIDCSGTDRPSSQCTAYASSFLDEASTSYAASIARQKMGSQLENTMLDRNELLRATGLSLAEHAFDAVALLVERPIMLDFHAAIWGRFRLRAK
ncbi:hypothetical protein OSJ57_23865 [Sphingomonas sp. HH69]